MDDVTFGRSRPDGDTWRLHVAGTMASGVAIPGMSTNALFACVCILIADVSQLAGC